MEQEKLLQVLEHNARMEVKDLALVLNEQEEDVMNVMHALEKDKIICGYHTIINWDKTNQDHVMAMIEVKATPQRDCGYDKVADRISRFPEVESLYLMSGRAEFMVIIQGRTMKEVAKFVGQSLAPLEGVTGTVTTFVLKRYKVAGINLEGPVQDQERLLML